MQFWTDLFIKPYIKENKYKYLCEIGACCGTTTAELLMLPHVFVTIIDPCLDEDIETKYKHNPRVEVCKGLSLEFLPQLSRKFDCILIDGDHNWYTVHSELTVIEEKCLLKRGGSIILHDVGWPYGRRDMYYLPETIPTEFRHPYAQKGIIQGISALSSTSGINKHLNNAMSEGGPRNGVLTAIEDFIKEHQKDYRFFYFNLEFGLGVLQKPDGLLMHLSFVKWVTVKKMGDVILLLKNVTNIVSPSLHLWIRKIYLKYVKQQKLPH